MDLRLCMAELDPEHEAAESDSLSDALELLGASDPSMVANHYATATPTGCRRSDDDVDG